MNCSKVASQNAFVTLILLMIQLPSSQMLTNAHKIFTNRPTTIPIAFRFHWLDSAKTKTQLSTPTANMWAWTVRQAVVGCVDSPTCTPRLTADCWLLAGGWRLVVGQLLRITTTIACFTDGTIYLRVHGVALLLFLLANVYLRAPQWIHSQNETHSTGKRNCTHGVAQNYSQHVWTSA